MTTSIYININDNQNTLFRGVTDSFCHIVVAENKISFQIFIINECKTSKKKSTQTELTEEDGHMSTIFSKF